nr:MAG TPA: major capsid protein [Caudoviricetes sp.]
MKPSERKNNEMGGSLQRYLTECCLTRMEGEGNERKFTLSFSSEEPYNRWWGTEILSHTDNAVDLDRLNSIGVVLYNHNRDKVIGKILRAWVDGNRGYAEIEFDTDTEAEVIYQKVSGGTLKGVSVGYVVDVWEEVSANKKSSDGRFTGPCDIATRWTPYEISIVSVPADPTVGVGRSQEQGEGKKGVSSFYYYEKQLQINKNHLTGGKDL